MRLPKQIYIYFFSYFFTAGLSFFTVSLLTHHLTTNDYGIINLYSSFITLLMPFITGGVMYPISIEYYKKAPEDFKLFFSNAQVITIISLLLFTLLAIILQQPLKQFLHVPVLWVCILPYTVWGRMVNESTMLMCRVKNKAWGFAFFSISKNVIEILLTIGLVIGLSWAWQGRLVAAVASLTILCFVSIHLFFRWRLVANTIDWQQVKHIAWISVPFIFERLTIFVLSSSDRYFIDKLASKGTGEVGLYSVGAQIATIITLAILSMNSAYQPHVFKNLAVGNKERVKKSTLMYVGGAGLLVVALFLATPLIFKLFIGNGFADARVYAYYLSGGYFMWAIYNAFLPYLLFHGKNRLILYLSVAGMIVSVSSNFYLVPHYGAYGAALTSIMTYTVMAFLSIFFSWKYFK